MPVRDIPIGTRALTGQHVGSGARYESGLERDFYELMSQDPLLDTVDWQPVTIEFTGGDGKRRTYTPDSLVTFKRDPDTGMHRRPLLVEVKYREEYRKKFSELKERFRAARHYARERGWKFKVVTERGIRTVAFSNRRFLGGYKYREPDQDCIAVIKSHLHPGVEKSVSALLASISGDTLRQAQVLPTLWWMVAHAQLHIDIFKPLSMEAKVSMSAWG
jgi:hypothetical protein